MIYFAETVELIGHKANGVWSVRNVEVGLWKGLASSVMEHVDGVLSVLLSILRITTKLIGWGGVDISAIVLLAMIVSKRDFVHIVERGQSKAFTWIIICQNEVVASNISIYEAKEA